MPDFDDFPYGEAHKESPAAVKAATKVLVSNKKTILQQFDRLTCPTNTDPVLARAEAHTLLLDTVFGAQNYQQYMLTKCASKYIWHDFGLTKWSRYRDICKPNPNLCYKVSQHGHGHQGQNPLRYLRICWLLEERNCNKIHVLFKRGGGRGGGGYTGLAKGWGGGRGGARGWGGL